MGTPLARAFVFGAVLALAGACGGSEGPPAPLARHFDEMQFLGGIPVDQREEELKAKSEYDRALMLQAKEKADFDEAKTQMDVAKNERDAARLDEKSAIARQKAAKDSADMNRIKAADDEMNGARLAADAADKRYLYLSAFRTWKSKTIRWAEHNTYWMEARYELAQAKIAQKNNIQPKGFMLDNFVKQESDRARKVKDAAAKAENEKQDAMAARTNWLAIQKQSDKLLGKVSTYPDPMDPNKAKGDESKGYSSGSDESETDKYIQPSDDPTKRAPPPPPDKIEDEGDDMNESDEGGGGGGEQADPDEGGE